MAVREWPDGRVAASKEGEIKYSIMDVTRGRFLELLTARPIEWEVASSTSLASDCPQHGHLGCPLQSVAREVSVLTIDRRTIDLLFAFLPVL